jgi:hypothetical protein
LAIIAVSSCAQMKPLANTQEKIYQQEMAKTLMTKWADSLYNCKPVKWAYDQRWFRRNITNI